MLRIEEQELFDLLEKRLAKQEKALLDIHMDLLKKVLDEC